MAIEVKMASERYYLIGEMHGTAEAPAACMDIMRRYHIKSLALELDKSQQHEIDAYYAGTKSLEDITLFHNPQKHDGRASSAVKNLLAGAKKRGIKVYLVDDASTPLERDKGMAENLRNIEGKVAFLCGNIHASKKPIRIPKAVVVLAKLLRKIRLSKLLLPSDGIIQTCGSILPNGETVAFNVIASGNYTQTGIIPSPDKRYGFSYVVRQFTYVK